MIENVKAKMQEVEEKFNEAQTQIKDKQKQILDLQKEIEELTNVLHMLNGAYTAYSTVVEAEAEKAKIAEAAEAKVEQK